MSCPDPVATGAHGRTWRLANVLVSRHVEADAMKFGTRTCGVSRREAILVPRTRMLYLSASWPDRYKAEVADDADFRQLANFSLQHPRLTFYARILHCGDLCSTLNVHPDLQGLCGRYVGLRSAGHASPLPFRYNAY